MTSTVAYVLMRVHVAWAWTGSSSECNLDEKDYVDAKNFYDQIKWDFSGLQKDLTRLNSYFPNLGSQGVNALNMKVRQPETLDIYAYFLAFAFYLALQVKNVPKWWSNWRKLGVFSSQSGGPLFEPPYAKLAQEMYQSYKLTALAGNDVKNNAPFASSKNNYWMSSRTFYLFPNDEFKNQLMMVDRGFMYIFCNPPNEAVYFQCNSDSDGKPLNSKNAYSLTFTTPQMVGNGFWSITSYNLSTTYNEGQCYFTATGSKGSQDVTINMSNSFAALL